MKISQLISVISIALVSCIEPYEPKINNEVFDILVVDGYINTTDRSAQVRLSRAIPVDSVMLPSQENNATVLIEDEGGTTYSLINSGLGIYVADDLGLDQSKKYRLHVVTSADEEYVSDYVTLKSSPLIDSVIWKPDVGGISIYVNTHDPDANSHYYEWTYEETWEYRSSFNSTYKVVDGIAYPRTFDEQIFTCWSTQASTKLLVGTSDRLSADVIRDFPIIFIPGESSKLSLRYSIQVQQRVLSKDEFDFKRQLERTTESLGGLFDAMPSAVVGNIRSTNPTSTNPVLGYFSGGGVSKQRIFIDYYDLPTEILAIHRPPLCNEDNINTIPIADIATTSDLLIYPIFSQSANAIVAYTAASRRCVDCTVSGGTTKRPDFW
jgi:hypothetical protein